MDYTQQPGWAVTVKHLQQKNSGRVWVKLSSSSKLKHMLTGWFSVDIASEHPAIKQVGATLGTDSQAVLYGTAWDQKPGKHSS